MELAEALAPLCPSPGSVFDVDDDDGECMLELRSLDGVRIRCHMGLLLARCPLLPLTIDGVVDVSEDAAVVYALLRWVYGEKAPHPDSDAPTAGATAVAEGRNALTPLGPRVVRLGRAWGLRDVGSLHARLAAGRRTCQRAGTLTEDVLRAYDAGAARGRIGFRAAGARPREIADEAVLSGWLPVLRSRSRYFNAMLSGTWAETAQVEVGDRGGEPPVVVELHWPQESLARMVRFLHGGPFVADAGDLSAAVECGKFFGVPSLVAHASEWIASHLQPAIAPSLWCYVDAEPALKNPEVLDAVDADAACFEYHVENFTLLAAQQLCDCKDAEVEGAEVPLHQISIPLMHRLLSSGRVAMSTQPLLEAVEKFIRARCGRTDTCPEERAKLVAQMTPPAVLFNRQIRGLLLGRVDTTIRAVL